MFANRFEGFRFDLICKPRREAHRTQHAQLVFREAAVRFADRAYDARAQICLPIDKIQYFAGVVPHQEAVDRKVPPLYVFLRRVCIDHAIRMASVAVAHIRAKRGDLDLNSVTGNQDHSELRSNGQPPGKKLQYLLRRCVGGHVIVSRFAPEQNIAHASAHQKRLESSVPERVANRIGQLSCLHHEIMRLRCG